MKTFMKYNKNMNSYFSKHVGYCSFVHAIAGIGFGVLLASPLMFPHPVRWAAIFIGIATAAHIYAAFAKK